MLKDEFLAEWRRLNPRNVAENAGFWLRLSSITRESALGYFAPLRLAYWLAKRKMLAGGGERNAKSTE